MPGRRRIPLKNWLGQPQSTTWVDDSLTIKTACFAADMSRNCHTCQHLKRPEIDRRLAAGEPVAQVARDYELNPRACIGIGRIASSLALPTRSRKRLPAAVPLSLCCRRKKTLAAPMRICATHR